LLVLLAIIALGVLIWILERFCTCFVSCRKKGVKRTMGIDVGFKRDYDPVTPPTSSSGSETQSPPRDPPPWVATPVLSDPEVV